MTRITLRFLFLNIALIFSITLLYYIIQNQTWDSVKHPQIKQVLGTAIHKETIGLPIRLIIPAINVDTEIQYVGVTSDGVMGVPDNTVDVGWFFLGPRPGERGSAVIAGHFNGENGTVGVFANLYKLKHGDKVYTQDDKGVTIFFTVRTSRIYDPGYANDVFSPNDSAHLNLITCDGVWDDAQKSYSKRLVVFADITH